MERVETPANSPMLVGLKGIRHRSEMKRSTNVVTVDFERGLLCAKKLWIASGALKILSVH